MSVTLPHIATLLMAIAQPQFLTLATQSQSPQQLLNQTESDTRSVATIRCILDKEQVQSEILMLPWARAKRELAEGNVDGVFLTSVGEVEEGIGSFPMVLEKWYVYQRLAGKSGGQSHRLGVVRGSDVESWLLEHNRVPYLKARDMHQLLQQFVAGRIDYFVADDLQVKTLLHSEPQNLSIRFLRYRAKNVTFSHQFHQKYPDFITRFNRRIGECNPQITQLSPLERQQAIKYVEDQVIPALDQGFREELSARLGHQAPSPGEEIALREATWREELKSGEYRLIAESLDNPLAERLKVIQAGLPAVGELMVTRDNGELLAVSRVTSDYWQGDEAKITDLGHKAIEVGDLEYDESTSSFVAHVSVPLQSPQGRAILVVGLSLERILIGEL
ncbi:type 2 periplasmic-binding domain-containing protein [Bowmanella dokdonensis]|uniref:Solute-binding protein family 3/N-terminal domain-containing protein n=1 Tax=Bowmanella dokdonensis TaxID=751969 RepID=A0A939DSM8_9ALTE|nr:hypothetical protein [Bowmanella dokdonensis]MBN7827470.1 hypothetical protein [Bowmanella dokdonensis]